VEDVMGSGGRTIVPARNEAQHVPQQSHELAAKLFPGLYPMTTLEEGLHFMAEWAKEWHADL